MTTLNVNSLLANAMTIVDQKVDDIVLTEDTKYVSEFFELDPASQPSGQAMVVGRFVPNFFNPSKHILNRTTYRLSDATGAKRHFISPVTQGRWNDCMIYQTYKKIKDSKDPQKIALSAEAIKYKKENIVLFQIAYDPCNTKNNGKFVFLRLDHLLLPILEAKLHPSEQDIKSFKESNGQFGSQPENIFDVFEGRQFTLKAAMKDYGESKGRDFTLSSWGDKKIPLVINGEELKKPTSAVGSPEYNTEITAELTKFVNYLQENEDLNLAKFDFKDYSDEDKKYIQDTCMALTDGSIKLEDLKTDEVKEDVTVNANANANANTTQASPSLADVNTSSNNDLVNNILAGQN